MLHRDFDSVSYLWRKRKIKVVPEPFLLADVKISTQGRESLLSIAIMQWLQGYCEWHFTAFRPHDDYQIVFWNNDKGCQQSPASDCGFRIFHEISRILAYCFSPSGLKQICLWNNSAGDFVIRKDDRGRLRVKLTTVRRYDRLVDARDFASGNEAVIFALIYLFLELMLNIRLDRLDGTGEYFFAGPEFLVPSLRGFAAGLGQLAEEGHVQRGILPHLSTLLSSMSSEELFALYSPLLERYVSWKRADVDFLKAHLPAHCRELVQTLRMTEMPWYTEGFP